jgi:zinc protease
VLSELRDGQGYVLDNFRSRSVLYPHATYTQRLPIGTVASLEAATAKGLKAFWQAHYVPAKTTLVVVGDIDPAAIEARIKARFGDWQAAPGQARPDQGKVDPARRESVSGSTPRCPSA